VAACAAHGVAQLRSGRAQDAARLGQDAIALLDRHNHAVPLFLLRQTADATLTSGDGDTGEALLERAMRYVESGGQQGIDPLDRARVLGERARRLINRGQPAQAEPLLRQSHQLFTTAGSELEAATAMGEIADIAYQRGDYDEALRIHREVQLPVYQHLGDTRSTAITWGKIADIAYQRGDYDSATELQRKRLDVHRQLGDLDGIAAANWGLAKIDLAQHDYQSAFHRAHESFQILRHLRRPDGIAIVGVTLAQLLVAADLPDDAHEVLDESLAAATSIGSADLIRQIHKLRHNLPDDGNEQK